jgi:hypothetical protein
MLIGYARVSTSGQDLAAQRDGLAALGVEDQHVYVDHGLSGTTRARPGLREALAACRAGDVLVVTKLDRLARSLRDATDIADELTKKGVALNLGGAVYDPTDPVGRLLFNVLGMVAEFEADPHPGAHPGGHGDCEGRRQAPRPQAKAHPVAGEAPRAAAPHRRAHHQRHRRVVRGSPFDGLPGDSACGAALVKDARTQNMYELSGA